MHVNQMNPYVIWGFHRLQNISFQPPYYTAQNLNTNFYIHWQLSESTEPANVDVSENDSLPEVVLHKEVRLVTGSKTILSWLQTSSFLG
jgi:hypothetical protein